MNKATLAILAALSVSIALADDFKTTDGKEYKNVKVSRAEPDGIVITFSGGIVKLPFAELPPEIQKQYSYDSQAAAEFAEKSAAAQQALRLATQQTQQKADAARSEELSAAQDEKRLREADRRADSLLVYAIVEPHTFSRSSTRARVQLCYQSHVGTHNEGLNVVQDFAWKPNDLAKPFNAVIDEPMPQKIKSGDTIPVALYRIGHSDDSSRLPRFTLLKEKAIQFILTGSPQ